MLISYSTLSEDEYIFFPFLWHFVVYNWGIALWSGRSLSKKEACMKLKVGQLPPRPTWDWGLPLRLSKSDSRGRENPSMLRIPKHHQAKIASSYSKMWHFSSNNQTQNHKMLQFQSILDSSLQQSLQSNRELIDHVLLFISEWNSLHSNELLHKI